MSIVALLVGLVIGWNTNQPEFVRKAVDAGKAKIRKLLKL